MKRLIAFLALLTGFVHADEITGLNLRTTAGSQAVNPTAVAGAVLSLDANKRPTFGGPLTFSAAGVATFAPTALSGSQATSALDISQTWNTSGTPTALKLNVTDTASNSASKLMDLQVGGASKFSVYKNSGVELANILNQFTVGPGPGAVNARFLVDTVQASVAMNVGCSLGWSSDFQSITSNSLDLILGRDSAATLQLGADAATTPTAQTIKAHDVTTGTGASLTIAGGKGSVAGGSVVLATSATNGDPVAVLTIDAAQVSYFSSGGVVLYAGGSYSGVTPSAGQLFISDGSSVVKSALIQNGNGQLIVSKDGAVGFSTTTNAGNGGEGPTWKSGSGSPEGVVTSVVGSIYSRTDGGAGTSFYVKESGTGNTGWVAK